jgi:hypothetical protein
MSFLSAPHRPKEPTVALHSLTPDALLPNDLIHLGGDWVSVQSTRQADVITDNSTTYVLVITVDEDGGWFEDYIDIDRRLAVCRP